MIKTIREIALELSISKEAIYRKINYSMRDELSSHVVKKDGKTYVSVIGQSIIYQSLKKEKSEQVGQIQNITEDFFVTNNNPLVSNKENTETMGLSSDLDISVTNMDLLVTNQKNALTSEYITHLEKQLNILQTRYDQEVTQNRQEREMLYQLNQNLIDTFNNEQHLKIADKTLQIQEQQSSYKNYVSDPPKTKNGLLKRIFRKN